MPTFNLLCHGMMLYVEDGSFIDILIPEIKEHDYRFGSPAGVTCGPFPDDIPPGDYSMAGIPVPANPSTFAALDDTKHLVLKGSLFEVVAGLSRISLQIPKPNRILQYRPVTLSAPMKIFGSMPASVATRVPLQLHDVVVFSYDVADSTSVTIGSWYASGPIKSYTNLCIYSQTGVDSAQPTPAAPRPPHRTGTNDLLHTKGVGLHPDFALSVTGVAEPPPADPGYGISVCQLLNLNELAHFLTDGSGCGPAFVSAQA